MTQLLRRIVYLDSAATDATLKPSTRMWRETEASCMRQVIADLTRDEAYAEALPEAEAYAVERFGYRG